MSDMGDLASLFPDLPREVLQEFDTGGGRGPGPSQPLQFGGQQIPVTDDQVAAYLQSRGSLRAPLPPVVSGQQTPPTPQFYGNGRPAPMPGMATVEAPDYGQPYGQQQQQDPQQPQQPAQQPPAQPQYEQIPPPPPAGQQPQQPQQYTPPAPPPPQQFPPATPSLPDPNGPPLAPPLQPPAAPTGPRADGMDALADLMQADPQLRALVGEYLTTRRLPPVGQVLPQPPVPPAGLPSQYAPQPQQQFLPPPPIAPQQPQPLQQPQFDEYTDPAIRSLWERNQAIEQQLNEVRSSQRSAEQQNIQREMQHYSSIAESVASKFAADYQLNPQQLQEVRNVAARMGVATTYMNGVHPVTGQPVQPDIAQAMQMALNSAYYVAPSTRELETQRTIQRAQADADRQRRLGGVGGSSASVSRATPQPSTPQQARDAMNREVAEMFNGSWTGSN